MPTEAQLTVRLTLEERAQLDALVLRRNAELADQGGTVTAAGFLRGLLRRELAALAAAQEEEPSKKVRRGR